MVLKLYKTDLSPPVRAVMMACDVFNVPVEMIEVNCLEKDHLKPEYVKKNPLHTVPVLEDDNIILHDSHAILMYLADTYAKDESWYPKETKARALVNQKLFFDACSLFPALLKVVYAIVREEQKTIAQNLIDNIDEAYSFVEQFLSKTKYIAGEQITIADLSVISDVTSLALVLPIDAQKYPRLQEYVTEMEKKPYCEKINKPGVKILEEKVINRCKLS